VRKIKADILAVQEVKEDYVFKQMIKNRLYSQYSAVLTKCGGFSQQKLGFVYNKNKLNLIKFEEDLQIAIPNEKGASKTELCSQGSRPLAIGTFETKSKKNPKTYIVIAVHLKAGGEPTHITKRFQQHSILQNVVRKYQFKGYKNIIVLGDFNSTEYKAKKRDYKRFVKSVEKMNAIDTTAKLQCSSYWWGGEDDDKQHPSILDHIILSKNLVRKGGVKTEVYGHCKALACKVSYEDEMGKTFDEISDHCPIVTEIN